MKFEKQVKVAKKKQLENRIIRDVTFIVLGIVFLTVSIIMAISDGKKKANEENTKTTTSSVKNEKN